MALTDKNTSHDSSGSCTPGTTSIRHILGDGEAESASKATPSTIEMDSELQECEIQSRSLTSNLSRADDIGKFGEDEASKSLEVIDPLIFCLLLLYLLSDLWQNLENDSIKIFARFAV
jgi:cAMP phosphodiesterase